MQTILYLVLTEACVVTSPAIQLLPPDFKSLCKQ